MQKAEINELNTKAKELLKTEVTGISYSTWISNIEIFSVDDTTITIMAQNIVHKDMLESRYLSLLKNTFSFITHKNYDVKIICEEDMPKDEAPVIPTNTPNSSNLNPKYTFNSFVVGNNNSFAHAAALAVAEAPATAYNPLFLYGKSGLGKTHLMHAIGNYIINNTNLKVLYVTSDDFVNDFIRVVRNKDKENFELINTFKAKYRNVDVLMIDDIQFLENAAATQQEFFHTFNELYNSNRQIIISSDRSVNDLKLLEDRLRTRFACGLTANIFPPDLELSKNIIKKKIMYQESAKDIPEDVIDYIANSFSTDVRSLEGAITRVFAYSLMMGHGEITLDVAVDALKDQMIKSCNFKNDIHRIQMVVSDYFHIKVEDLKGKKRSKSIAFPRQIAIYLCRTLTNESFPRIGGYFGGRDHSTIMHSYDKISVDIKKNEQVKEIIKDIKKTLSN